MIWLIFAGLGAGYGLLIWFAFRFPFASPNPLRLPASLLRLIILAPVVLFGVPAILHEGTGPVLAAGAAVSFGLALAWDLTIQRRQRRAAERMPLSDEVVDRIFDKSLRAAGAAGELQRGLLRQTLFALAIGALGLVLPASLTVILGALGDGSAPSAGLAGQVESVVRVVAVGVPLLLVGVHLVGPLLLGLVEWWHVAGLTDNERQRAGQRALRVRD